MHPYMHGCSRPPNALAPAPPPCHLLSHLPPLPPCAPPRTAPPTRPRPTRPGGHGGRTVSGLPEEEAAASDPAQSAAAKWAARRAAQEQRARAPEAPSSNMQPCVHDLAIARRWGWDSRMQAWPWSPWQSPTTRALHRGGRALGRAPRRGPGRAGEQQPCSGYCRRVLVHETTGAAISCVQACAPPPHALRAPVASHGPKTPRSLPPAPPFSPQPRSARASPIHHLGANASRLPLSPTRTPTTAHLSAPHRPAPLCGPQAGGTEEHWDDWGPDILEACVWIPACRASRGAAVEPYTMLRHRLVCA